MIRWKPFLGALVVALVANLAGVMLFFKPIADGESLRFTVNPAVGLLVYVVLCLGLFDWAAQRMGSAYRAAFVVAASQGILVLDLLMRGDRGPATAAAGVGLLAVTWFCVAFAYSFLGGVKRAGSGS